MQSCNRDSCTYELKQEFVICRFKRPGQHVLQGVGPVFITVRTDAYIIDCSHLLGGKAANPDTMLSRRQRDEVCEASVVAALATKHGEESVVKPPTQRCLHDRMKSLSCFSTLLLG